MKREFREYPWNSLLFVIVAVSYGIILTFPKFLGVYLDKTNHNR